MFCSADFASQVKCVAIHPKRSMSAPGLGRAENPVISHICTGIGYCCFAQNHMISDAP